MKPRSIFFLCALALITAALVSCDFYKPRKSFRFAVPRNDFIYGYMYSHLKPLLEQNGYEISVVYTDRIMQANRLVAAGKADLTFVNNVSSFIADSLGRDAENLRTILPLTRRALLGFTREATDPRLPIRQILENKIIGVELLNGEGHRNIVEMLAMARVPYAKIVQSSQANYDVRLIWGSLYGKRATEMLDSGWHAISFSPEWNEFQALSDPALEATTLPALPGDPNSITVHTLTTTAVLVGSKDIGEHAVYLLTEKIMQGKLALVRQDPMYHSITESINGDTLLYPLHEGTTSYLRRDTPTFLERYADSLALAISLFVLLYGVFQAVKTYLNQVKKDRIDAYFLEFLDIRSQAAVPADKQIQMLNDLFHRALLQMTSEKMDKGDFNIFSRLIQQELTNLRLHASSLTST